MVQQAAAQHEASTLTWTDQLVRDRQHSKKDAPTPAVHDWAAQACAVLWTLFQESVDQANDALVAEGLTERLTITAHDHGYQVSLNGDGPQHQIRVDTGLRQVGDHLSGGAQITTSATRATIYLVTELTAAGPRWTIPASGCAFTATHVGDLLLGVFGDDGAAISRLLPCFSLGDSF